MASSKILKAAQKSALLQCELLEELEQRLTALEYKMAAIVRSALTEDELFGLRR